MPMGESEILPVYTPFIFKGRKYELSATLNVQNQFIKEFKDPQKLKNMTTDIDLILFQVAALVNEAVDIHNESNPAEIWERVTPQQIGRVYDRRSVKRLAEVIAVCLKNSRPAAEEDDEDLDEETDGSGEDTSPVPDEIKNAAAG